MADTGTFVLRAKCAVWHLRRFEVTEEDEGVTEEDEGVTKEDGFKD